MYRSKGKAGPVFALARLPVSSGICRRLIVAVDLLVQVEVNADGVDDFKLRFQGVYVLFLLAYHPFQDAAGGVVAHRSAVGDGLGNRFNRALFRLQVQIQVFP